MKFLFLFLSSTLLVSCEFFLPEQDSSQNDSVENADPLCAKSISDGAVSFDRVQNHYSEMAGTYRWEGAVMDGEYDTYVASIVLRLDSNGYFTWTDDFPTGPESDKFDLVGELQYPLSGLDDYGQKCFPGEIIESLGRYTVRDSAVELFFFAVSESFEKTTPCKSEDKQVDVKIDFYSTGDTLTLLSGKKIKCEYTYSRLNDDSGRPSKKKIISTQSGTLNFKLPVKRHVDYISIDADEFYGHYFYSVDTTEGFDYNIKVFLGKMSEYNSMRHNHLVGGTVLYGSGKDSLRLLGEGMGWSRDGFLLAKEKN